MFSSISQYHMPNEMLRITHSQDMEFPIPQESLVPVYHQQLPIVQPGQEESTMTDATTDQFGMSLYGQDYWQRQLLQADVSQLFPQQSYHMDIGDRFDTASCGTLSRSRTSTVETDVSVLGANNSWLSISAETGPSTLTPQERQTFSSLAEECHSFKCFFPYCDQTFKRKTDLGRHLFSTHGRKNHQGRRRFLCEICNKVRQASRYDVAQRHLKKCWNKRWEDLPFDIRQLSIDYKQQFKEQQCFYGSCTHVCDNKKQLKRHLFQVHGKSVSHKLVFRCPKCCQMKSFTRSEVMEEHQRKCPGRS
ncbi:hypothetical protein BJV82DRAFT_374124 [Fennellomyces sp. T-0311]|nr:hypothetical protein BJV82DRAFT_374124 [Fennellomyces sp. T-0311]